MTTTRLHTDQADAHQRERRHHDEWAAEVSVEHVAVREAFEAPAALENRFILHRMGDLRGKAILDVGCGLGESSVYFALQGARVTAADLSPGMVDFAERLARHHQVSVKGVVCPAETLQVADTSYDFVYIANLLHHVVDKRSVFQEVRRVLRPGGWFFSWDPLAYNPIINVYRRMATRVRSMDEKPLTFGDVAIAKEFLASVRHREFWILSLGLFLKYYLFDRVHPNEDRYWKRILRESPRTLRWWLPLRRCDEALTRLPVVRRLAWNMVMWGQSPVSCGVGRQ